MRGAGRWGEVPIPVDTGAGLAGSFPDERRDPGVAASNVGGAADNGRMNEYDTCDRCEGSGADPVQSFEIDEIALCVECRGDGIVVSFDIRRDELRLTA